MDVNYDDQLNKSIKYVKYHWVRMFQTSWSSTNYHIDGENKNAYKANVSFKCEAERMLHSNVRHNRHTYFKLHKQLWNINIRCNVVVVEICLMLLQYHKFTNSIAIYKTPNQEKLLMYGVNWLLKFHVLIDVWTFIDNTSFEAFLKSCIEEKTSPMILLDWQKVYSVSILSILFIWLNSLHEKG